MCTFYYYFTKLIRTKVKTNHHRTETFEEVDHWHRLFLCYQPSSEHKPWEPYCKVYSSFCTDSPRSLWLLVSVPVKPKREKNCAEFLACFKLFWSALIYEEAALFVGTKIEKKIATMRGVLLIILHRNCLHFTTSHSIWLHYNLTHCNIIHYYEIILTYRFAITFQQSR